MRRLGTMVPRLSVGRVSWPRPGSRYKLGRRASTARSKTGRGWDWPAGTLNNNGSQSINALTFNGGTVDLGTAGALFLTNTLTVNSGNATITGSGSVPYLDLNINQAAGSGLIANVQRSFVVNGNLTINTRINDGGINLTGTGTLILQGDSSSGYELKTNIASGSTLVVQHNNALGLATDATITSS